jgi:hypothetical protein
VLFDSEFDNKGEIVEWLDLNTPWRRTGDPLLLEMRQFLKANDYAPNFTGDAVLGEAYLIVISDGGDSCGQDGLYDASLDWTDELEVVTAALSERGIHTIPVGYSESADAETLDRIAKAGGTRFERHIPAADHSTLTEALLDIGDIVFSCGFEIDDPSPNADQRRINLYLDGGIVPFDKGCAQHVGWTWSDDKFRRIHLCADACQKLRAAEADDEAADVVAKFGCPVVVV